MIKFSITATAQKQVKLAIDWKAQKVTLGRAKQVKISFIIISHLSD